MITLFASLIESSVTAYNQMTISETYIVGAIAAVFATLTGAISILYAATVNRHNELQKRQDACEERDRASTIERAQLWAKIAELTGDSEMLQRCPSQACPMRLHEADGREVPTQIIARPITT